MRPPSPLIRYTLIDMPDTIVTAIGSSAHTNAAQAGREAAQHALSRLAALRPQVAFVFGSSWFDQEQLLVGVRSVLGTTPLVGGSTAGEITSDGPSRSSCVVMLVASSCLDWSVGAGEHVEQFPRDAGQQMATSALREFRGSPRMGLLLFGDGLVTSYAEVVRGVQEVLGTSSLIVGGMTGDDLRFIQTSQYFNDQVLHRAVVGALVGGAGRIGVGMEHGFAPISKPRHITRAHANVLEQLDDQPAASVYEEYFGHELVHQLRSEGLTRRGIAYPLGIQCERADQWVLRNVLSFEENGSLVCSGEMVEGSWVQLMLGSKDLALNAAHRAAQQAVQSLNHVAGVLVFDSAVRRKLLGEQQAAAEIARIRHTVGTSVPLAGCYTYGEQAPLAMASVYGRTVVQSGSVLVVALGR